MYDPVCTTIQCIFLKCFVNIRPHYYETVLSACLCCHRNVQSTLYDLFVSLKSSFLSVENKQLLQMYGLYMLHSDSLYRQGI